MDAFWKWLMRANARWVFYCALVALIPVIAWWTWKEFSPLEPRRPPASAFKNEPPPVAGIARLIERASIPGSVDIPGQCVHARRGRLPPPSRRTRRPTLARGSRSRSSRPRTPRPRRSSRGHGQPDLPRPLKGTDGKVVALIEDSKSKGSAFLFRLQRALWREARRHRHQSSHGDLERRLASCPCRFGSNVMLEGGKRAN